MISFYGKSGWRVSGRAVLAGRCCWVLWVEATGGRWRREMMPDPEHQSSFQQAVSVDTQRDATQRASLPGHSSERIHTHFHFTSIFVFSTYAYETGEVFLVCSINTYILINSLPQFTLVMRDVNK